MVSSCSAPTCSSRRSSRRARLRGASTCPRGRWVDLWDTVGFRPADGSFRITDRASLRRGPRSITADAPLNEIPVYAKAGTLLPLLSADVETLASYGDRAHVNLDDRRDRLHVIALPHGQSTARFGANGRLRSDERGSGWRLEIASPDRVRLDLEVSMATLERPFRPRVVRLNGRRLTNDWSFDPESRALHVDQSVRDGTITVSP